MSGGALVAAGMVLAAGAGAASGWWFGFGQGFTKAILGSDPVAEDGPARVVSFGLAVSDDVADVADVGRRPA